MDLVIITFILILVLILFLFIYETNINLFVRGFRFINSHDNNKVDLGIYEDRILEIEEREVVKVKVENYPDVELTFYQPRYDFDKLPVIMFIHGGGWIGGSAKKIASFCKLLASNGYVVVSVDYSLAPEYPYPVSTFQLVAALNYIYKNSNKYKIDKDCIFIGGTSAGAHLTSQLGCLVSSTKYQEKVGVKINVSKLSGLILVNGIYNFKTVGDCKFPGMKHFVWAYMDEKDHIDQKKLNEVSTIKHINKNYPDVFITVGDKDPLREQFFELAEKLEEKKINYQKVFFEDANLNHDFIYRLTNEDTKKTYEEMIKFLKERRK